MTSLLKSDAASVPRLSGSPCSLYRFRSLAFCSLVLPVILVAGFLGSAFGTEKIGAKLFAVDAVTTPGKPVRLQARLMEPGLLRETGIGGEQLEFLIAGKKVGTSMTGGDGYAYLEYTSRMRGNQSLTVRLLPSKRVDSPEASATIATWEKRRAILLIEWAVLIDQPDQKTPLPDIGIGLLRSHDPKAAAGAAEELKRLSEFFFNLIYVERDGDPSIQGIDLREWLGKNGFPFGLRVKVKGTRPSLAERLHELKKDGWENLKAGLGRTRDFAEVLLDQRLKVVLIPGNPNDETPKKTLVAKDWKEARKLLQR
jgi:hypothetical protein